MKIIITITCTALVPIGFWISGFDFDQRGDEALKCFVTTLAAAVISFVVSCIIACVDDPATYESNQDEIA